MMNVIGSGRITDKQQFQDVVDGHKREGYARLIIEHNNPISHYYEMQFIVQLVEGMEQTGNVLVLYVGTEESFKRWEGETKRELEALGKMRKLMAGDIESGPSNGRDLLN